MHEKLKMLRIAANLTQEEAAKRLGVCQTAISMWESGNSKPRINMIKKIAEVYDCNVEQLFK